MSKVLGIHHSSVLVKDTKNSLGFYVDILGFEVNQSRPAMEFSGAWLIAGDLEIHLLELPNPDATSARPEHVGRDRHLAMKVLELGSFIERFKQEGIAYTRSQSGRSALFCRDPDGNGIELIESTA